MESMGRWLPGSVSSHIPLVTAFFRSHTHGAETDVNHYIDYWWLLFTAVIWTPHNVIYIYCTQTTDSVPDFFLFLQHVSNMNFNVSPECLSFSGKIPKWIIVFEGRRRRPALLSRPFLCNNPRLLGVLDSISLQSFLIYQSHNLLLTSPTSPTGQELPVGQGLVSHSHGVAVTLRGQCSKSLLIKKGILLPNMLGFIMIHHG